LDAVCVGTEGDEERIETRWVGKDLARVKESESCDGVVEHGRWVGVRVCLFGDGPRGVR
jgi:hypothetical protein